MIQAAIAQLDEEILALGPTKPGTSSWALLQAKSLAASFLRKAELLKLTEPEDIEAFRKRIRKGVMGIEDGQEAGVKPVNSVSSADAPGT